MYRSLAIVVLSLSIAVVAAAQDDIRDALLDPLPVRDQFVLSNGFFFFEPEGARVLGDGQSQIDIHDAESNTFAKSRWITRTLTGDTSRMSGDAVLAAPRYGYLRSMYLVDGQSHRVTMTWRRGLGPDLQIGIAIPVGWIGGGWSDGTIEAAHHAMGIGDDVREAMRQNREIVYLRNGDTTYFRDHSAGASLGDVALTAKYELRAFEDRKTKLALMGAIELPTGDARMLDGSGSLDGGMQLIVSRDTRYVRVHATVGLLRLGPNAPLGTRSRIILTDTVAVSRLLTPRTAAIAQITISESPFRDLGMAEFSRRTYQLTLGAQRRVGRGLSVYGGLIENVVTFENSADVGLQWGVSKRF